MHILLLFYHLEKLKISKSALEIRIIFSCALAQRNPNHMIGCATSWKRSWHVLIKLHMLIGVLATQQV